MQEKIIIIDFSNIAIRVYKSFEASGELLMCNGEYTFVTYGFLKYIQSTLALKECKNATRIIFALDIGKSKQRLELYPEYKGNRIYDKDDPVAKSVFKQMDVLKGILKHLPVHQLGIHGFEADDVIAACCQLFPNDKKIIVSADKDLAQLIDDNTTLYKLGMFKDDHKFITPKNFHELDKENIPYNQVVDFKIVKGDASDNIKGVKGLGEVARRVIFHELGGLSSALAMNPDNVDKNNIAKIIRTLQDNKSVLELNRKLVDMSYVVNDEFLLEVGEQLSQEMCLNEIAVQTAFAKYELNSLLRNFDEFMSYFQDLVKKEDANV